MKYTILSMVIGLTLFVATSYAKGQDSRTDNKTSGTMTLQTSASSIGWHAKKVTGEHMGNLKFKRGNLIFNNGVLTGGRFDVDMKSISNTDIEDKATRAKLVGHLNSDDFFATASFPVASFVITKATQITNAKAGENNYNITGNMTIKGITHPVTFPAKIVANGDMVEASAEITLDRSKWDVRYGSGSFFDNLGDNLIYDDFTLNMDLKLKK